MLIFFQLRKSPVEKFWPFIYIKKLFKVCIYIYAVEKLNTSVSLFFKSNFSKSILQDDATQNNSPICTSTPIMASSLSLFFLIVIISNQFQCSEIFTRSFLFFQALVLLSNEKSFSPILISCCARAGCGIGAS